MVSNRVKGKIVLVSSLLGYSTFVGWTNYSPGKYALRGKSLNLRCYPVHSAIPTLHALGLFDVIVEHSLRLWYTLTSGLADSLRSEMLLHDISVHIFMPAGIDSPGYIVEQEHKPAPTKKLEEGDKVQSPEVVAAHLFGGELSARDYFVLYNKQHRTNPLVDLRRNRGKYCWD
jgi:3-dehydrosphinganine reductase